MDRSKVCELTDQDRMEDLLTQEKYLISTYSSFIPEATCQQLKSVLTSNFDGCVQNQTDLFSKMSQLGRYPVKSAPKPEVEAARQKYQQLKQQISAQTGGC
jgi:spore coat protein CotF